MTRVEVLLTEYEARELTAKIKGYAGGLWKLLYDAHRGRAWKPLGYASFTAYLDGEFEISRSRGYQFIDHARKVYELADVADVDVSTFVDTLSEGQTRNLDLDAATAKVAKSIKALGAGATEQQRVAVVVEVIERQTTKFAPQPKGPAPAGVNPSTGEIIEGQDPASPLADQTPTGDEEATAPTSAGPAEEPATSAGEPEPGGSSSLTGEEDPEESRPSSGSENEERDEEPTALDVLIAAGKYRSKAWDLFQKVDPVALAEALDQEGRVSWTGSLNEFDKWAAAFRAAAVPSLTLIEGAGS